MDFAPQQNRALTAVNDWLHDDSNKLFRLFGYAGTGKTTLAKHLAQGVDGDVMFGAFTGKAAHVLRSKGCSGAQTIHSMIYQTKDKSRERLRQLQEERDMLAIREEPPPDEDELARLDRAIAKETKNVNSPIFTLDPFSKVRDAALVVIDECSMVNEQMAMDLLSFGTKVLVLGDPAQLPPVKGGGWFTEAQPDFMLTDIHRQARDNPIIDLATRVREGQRLQYGTYGTSSITPSFSADEMLACDQLLVGKNVTRAACNKRMRAMKGFTTTDPQPGDRVVCLKNNNEIGILNGALFNVLSATPNKVDSDVQYLHLKSIDDDFEVGVDAYMHVFRGKELPPHSRFGAEQFDYGYALTVHKAQGSQWPNILVINESASFRENASRWLYTAITRAAESVRIVNP